MRAPRALLVPVAFAAGLAILLAANVSDAIPFDSDEANHANLALRQFQDLRDGRFTDFLRHSYRTGQFPFLHGWTLLPFFTMFGTTLYAARVAQCAMFVLGVASTGWAAWRASGGDRRAAAIGAGLFAASPYLATLSGLCMLEVPGAAATAVALAVFGEACRDDVGRGRGWHVAVAVAGLATYFVKLNFGIWILPALGAGYAVRWWCSADRRAALRDGLVYLGVVLVVLLLWYSSAAQRAAFMGFLHNPSQAVSVEADDPTFRVPGIHVGNFTAYFGLVATDFHLHWTIGAVALVLAAFGARRALRDPPIAAAAACLSFTWLVLSMGFREYPLARFIATALPPLWVLAACGAARLLPSVPWMPLAGTGALALGMGAQAAVQPHLIDTEYEVGREFAPVFDLLADAIPPASSVLAVGYTDHTSARTLEWCLGARNGRSWRDVNVVGLNSERVFESPRRLDEWMTAPRPWGRADWKSLVVEFRPGPDYADKALLVPATVAMWRDAVARHADRLERVASRRFGDIDLEVIVWRDRTPPTHLGLRR